MRHVLLALLLSFTGCKFFDGGGDLMMFDGSGASLAGSSAAQIAYRDTIWQVTNKHCIGCHSPSSDGGRGQFPMFAQNDFKAAELAAMQNNKINLQSVNNSRLYQRLANEGHNCWTNCGDAANTMLSALNAFASAMGKVVDGSGGGGTTTGTIVWSDSMPLPTDFTTNPTQNVVFSLAKFKGMSPGAQLRVSVALFNGGTHYRIFAPSLAVNPMPTGEVSQQIKVIELHVKINGTERPTDTAFVSINGTTTVTTNFQNLGPGSIITAKGEKANETIQVGFYSLTKEIALTPLQMKETAMKLFVNNNCLGCHSGGLSPDLRNFAAAGTTTAQLLAYQCVTEACFIKGDALNSWIYRCVARDPTAKPMPPAGSAATSAAGTQAIAEWMALVP